ncbi:hypothetical protein HBF26_18260 [Luteibacter jiangsuensis]|uniref:Uncharacterized protein n=1 Tax=Luteibacter jiangsuensis TaxID=637577 RepID=A0ABX0Q949_9GAMM|nr:hypothetical protein [Luteibacter jiangsuensis]NID06836.1 hypothetical protein [Luteibacter jiangsuensis]
MVDLTILIARPSAKRGLWRVRTSTQTEREFSTEVEAFEAAEVLAKFLITAGAEVEIQVERPDGLWALYDP